MAGLEPRRLEQDPGCIDLGRRLGRRRDLPRDARRVTDCKHPLATPGRQVPGSKLGTGNAHGSTRCARRLVPRAPSARSSPRNRSSATVPRRIAASVRTLQPHDDRFGGERSLPDHVVRSHQNQRIPLPGDDDAGPGNGTVAERRIDRNDELGSATKVVGNRGPRRAGVDRRLDRQPESPSRTRARFSIASPSSAVSHATTPAATSAAPADQ